MTPGQSYLGNIKTLLQRKLFPSPFTSPLPPHHQLPLSTPPIRFTLFFLHSSLPRLLFHPFDPPTPPSALSLHFTLFFHPPLPNLLYYPSLSTLTIHFSPFTSTTSLFTLFSCSSSASHCFSHCFNFLPPPSFQPSLSPLPLKMPHLPLFLHPSLSPLLSSTFPHNSLLAPFHFTLQLFIFTPPPTDYTLPPSPLHQHAFPSTDPLIHWNDPLAKMI